MEKLIEFSDVSLGYGKKIVMKDLNFYIKEKTFLGLVGPNESGKTTILKAILGLLKPLKGKISMNKVRAGYVPQRESIDEIYPFTVFDIVLMGRYSLIPPLKRPGKKDRTVVMKSLDYLGIKDLSSVPYRDLSGGQKQRVLIARALSGEPDLLILDEPTNGMDLASEQNIMKTVLTLHYEKELTVVFVTHYLELVANFAKEIIILDKDSFQFGKTNEIINDNVLSNIYNMKVLVDKSLGQTIILTGE